MNDTSEPSSPSASKFQTLSFLLVILVLGAVWLLKGPTDQEMLANAAKALDFHPWTAWWTSQFLGGSSQAPGLTTLFSYLLLKALVMPFGPVIGAKVAALLAALAGAFGVRAFLNRWTGDSFAGWLGGLAYLLGPQMALRLAANEHLPVVFAMVFAPWVLWALLGLARVASWKNALVLALLGAGMTLTFTKLAIAFGPLAALFAIYLLLADRTRQKPFLIGLGRALVAYIPLAVLVLLPTLREVQWLAMFRFDPFAAWQQNFSLRSVISWLDRGNMLQQGMSPGFLADQGGFYVGVVAVVVGFTAWWRASQEPREEDSAVMLPVLKMIFGMLLFVSWMSEGPRSIVQGMLEFLKASAPAPDWSIPIFWIMTVLQCVILWLIWPVHPRRDWFRIPALLAYLLLPGFRMFELLPFAGDIRAPWSVWQVGGSLTVALLFGVGAALLLKRKGDEGGARLGFAALLILLLALDYSPYLQRYATGTLPEGTYQAFDQICARLKQAPDNGTVYPLSGRYFYLQIPMLTGKPIEQEAFNSYFGLVWRRALQNATMGSPEGMRAGMSLMGCSYIFIDKQDPSTPPDLQKVFRNLFPTILENDFFAVLANPGALYPAFLAHDFVTFPEGSYLAAAPASLQLAVRNLITVEAVTVDQAMPGFAGMSKGQNQIDLLPQYNGRSGTPFARIPLAGSTTGGEVKRTFQVPPNASGWLVLTEAYHPDWTATIDGKPAAVHRADAALLSTYLPGGAHEVVFRFQAPEWYTLFLGLGALGWIVALSLLLSLQSDRVSPALRNWWTNSEG